MRQDDINNALRYLPVVLSQLDGTGKEMLSEILQAYLSLGYDDGFRDANHQQGDEQ